MGRWREKQVWHKDGSTTDLKRLDDGTISAERRNREGVLVECWTEDPSRTSPLPVFINAGIFRKNRPRRISGLARYPGDPSAVCRSTEEAEHKAAAMGARIVKPEDAIDHAAHRNGAFPDIKRGSFQL